MTVVADARSRREQRLALAFFGLAALMFLAALHGAALVLAPMQVNFEKAITSAASRVVLPLAAAGVLPILFAWPLHRNRNRNWPIASLVLLSSGGCVGYAAWRLFAASLSHAVGLCLIATVATAVSLLTLAVATGIRRHTSPAALLLAGTLPLALLLWMSALM